MLTPQEEKTTSNILLIGPALVTLTLFTQGVTDPVNVTKLFVLGGFSSALFFAISAKSFRTLWDSHKPVLVFVFLFLIFAVNSVLQTNAPFTQSFYGVYGRNNGFLLYFMLAISFVVTLTISQTRSFKNIVLSLIVASLVNIVYCLWVIIFGDFVGWSNPYGNILGTLGNPNFIGAFLGMFSSVLVTAMLVYRSNVKLLCFLLLLSCLTLFEIYKSNAIQGRVLFLAGLALNILIYLWVKVRNVWATSFASITILTLGTFGVLGTLQKGPLVGFLYKDSVSLRGQYWYSGAQMGLKNILTGVGFDSYGDWYRALRRPSALVRPGVDTVSNTAHNLFIDLFAFGGAPLLLSYLLLNIMVLVSIIKVLKRKPEFDFIFVSLTGSWACFQLQSLISINQIGLAIWGWILGAALIAFERSSLASMEVKEARRTKISKKQVEIFSPNLKSGIGILVGLLIAVPPLSADMKWRSAQISRNATMIENALKPSYLNPESTFKYLNIVGAFHDSGLDDLAHKYALLAIDFNPNSFDSWRLLTYIRTASENERQQAISEMHRLDPLNPNIVVGSK